MRLIVTSSYWPRSGNVHNAFFEVDQVRALAELGHEIDVLIQTEPWRWNAAYIGPLDLGLDPARVRLEQIVVPRLPEPFARLRAGAIINMRLAGFRMRAWLAAQGHVDAVIVHGERNIGLSAGIWNVGRARRTMMIVHGADPVLEALPASFLHRFAGKTANAGLDRIILVGNRLRTYARHLGYQPELIRVIPNGFRHPSPVNAALLRDEQPVRLVAAARLVEVKGLDDALLALSRVKAERPTLDWRFDILGDGPERSALEALSVRLGLERQVHFHGAVPHEQVLHTLERGAVFLLPSWNEAFGLAYLEAMAMGTAVVGCHGNGAADILTDGVDGCLVLPRDISALAATLGVLIGDPLLRERLARAAVVSVRRFSWSRNARAVLEALDD